MFKGISQCVPFATMKDTARLREGGKSVMGFRKFFWQRVVGAYPVTIRGERFVCLPRDRSSWRGMAGEKGEQGALDILDSCLSPQSVMWDIGANIGQLALYASRKCRRVVCFEPDLVSLSVLHWNLAHNRVKNVTVIGAALAEKTGFIEMGSFWDGGALGRSVTSSRPSPDSETIMAAALGPDSWGTWLREEPPDLIKMDIEGGEFELLPALMEWLLQNRPKFLLSLHAAPLRESGRMNAAEAREALEKCAELLSFYGEFTALATGEKYPLSELPARMSGDGKDDSIWMQGVFLE